MGGGSQNDQDVYNSTQLFTGTTSNPSFQLGNYAIDNYVDGGTLVISNPFATAATPEPAVWSMMILGFGVTGAALRRRRRGLGNDARLLVIP